MAGNSFGTLFRITTFGESHGPGIGVVIDGCPSQLDLDMDLIARDLSRRRPGQSAYTTARQEQDVCELLSGIVDGRTTGAPLTLWIPSKDARSGDYSHLEKSYRPSHADYTYEAKYGIRDVRGGGRSSARETAARVAAGAVAKTLLRKAGIEIVGYVCQVGEISMTERQPWSLEDVEESVIRCPDQGISERMQELIAEVRDAGDTVGGIIECVARGCRAGLGEPVFDKLQADLGKAILSINACKGFEIGSGFAGTTMRGSGHNDVFFTTASGETKTRTNYSGGVQGGISNGMDIVLRAAFKPVSTLMRPQESVDRDGNPVTLEGRGRHDPCVVPRAVPIVEAMTAIVLADHLLRQRALSSS
jgi:chorismate synthase